jgi:hypothetical protein
MRLTPRDATQGASKQARQYRVDERSRPTPEPRPPRSLPAALSSIPKPGRKNGEPAPGSLENGERLGAGPRSTVRRGHSLLAQKLNRRPNRARHRERRSSVPNLGLFAGSVTIEFRT